MGKILDFLTRRGSMQPPAASYEELLERLRPCFAPALRLAKTTMSSRSYLGGHPALPEDVAWPEKGRRPLTFLACIDLEEVASSGPVPWLPDTGRLLFFYDIENQPWGFDPEDSGSWAVLYVTTDCAERTADVVKLPKLFVRFDSIESIPSWERIDSLGIPMSEAECEAFYDGYFDRKDDSEEHQISGFPEPVQGDGMELESQLASNGIYVGDSSGYQDPRAKQLEPGARDWRLLLQLASDDDLGVMWGDCGVLYFWVREEDARHGDFSNVWLVLQCS